MGGWPCAQRYWLGQTSMVHKAYNKSAHVDHQQPTISCKSKQLLCKRAALSMPGHCPKVKSVPPLQICQGVHALHKCTPPLAHRDIKPHNVLLQRHQQHGSEAAIPIGSQSHPGDDLEAQPLHAVGAEPVGSAYHAVVMDFGSCQEAHVEVRNRTEALAVQEDAEVRIYA